MKKKYQTMGVIIGLFLVVTIIYSFMKNWNADGDQIVKISNIQENDFILASSENSLIGNWLHKIRYGSSSKIEGKLLAFSKNGNVHTITEVRNGYIDKYWIYNNMLYILYNSGENVYNNKNNNMKCIAYSITENNAEMVKKCEELDNVRIWGADSVIMSDERDNIICVNSNGNVEELTIDDGDNNLIQSISYNTTDDLYYILTNKKMISVDIKNKNEKETELTKNIYNIRDVKVLQ